MLHARGLEVMTRVDSRVDRGETDEPNTRDPDRARDFIQI